MPGSESVFQRKGSLTCSVYKCVWKHSQEPDSAGNAPTVQVVFNPKQAHLFLSWRVFPRCFGPVFDGALAHECGIRALVHCVLPSACWPCCWEAAHTAVRILSHCSNDWKFHCAERCVNLHWVNVPLPTRQINVMGSGSEHMCVKSSGSYPSWQFLSFHVHFLQGSVKTLHLTLGYLKLPICTMNTCSQIKAHYCKI